MMACYGPIDMRADLLDREAIDLPFYEAVLQFEHRRVLLRLELDRHEIGLLVPTRQLRVTTLGLHPLFLELRIVQALVLIVLLGHLAEYLTVSN